MGDYLALAVLLAIEATFLGLSLAFTKDDVPESEPVTSRSSKIISTNVKDIKYFLCVKSTNKTKGLMSHCSEMNFNDLTTLRATGFNDAIPSVILIHGFSGNHKSAFNLEIKKAYLTTSQLLNVIIVDWEKLAKPNVIKEARPLFYAAAFNNVPAVGKAIADFISFIWLVSVNSSYCPERFHLVGFDLGAHVAGMAGHNIINSNGNSAINRITGLDPSSVFFQIQVLLKLNNTLYLDSSDANFVDVIHTDQGIEGIIANLGHADFYPNGGFAVQPECLHRKNYDSDWVGTCSHNRAWQYFAQSIYDNTTEACKCNSYFNVACRRRCSETTTFGHFCPPTTRGQYYLTIYAM